MKSKLHRAVVTDADLEYEGSISLDPGLMDAAHIAPYESVHIYNITNGERFETYAIEGISGDICLNGAAAHKAKAGDRIIICCYTWLSDEEAAGHHPTVLLLDEKNQIKAP